MLVIKIDKLIIFVNNSFELIFFEIIEKRNIMERYDSVHLASIMYLVYCQVEAVFNLIHIGP